MLESTLLRLFRPGLISSSCRVKWMKFSLDDLV